MRRNRNIQRWIAALLAVTTIAAPGWAKRIEGPGFSRSATVVLGHDSFVGLELGAAGGGAARRIYETLSVGLDTDGNSFVEERLLKESASVYAQAWADFQGFEGTGWEFDYRCVSASLSAYASKLPERERIYNASTFRIGVFGLNWEYQTGDNIRVPYEIYDKLLFDFSGEIEVASFTVRASGDAHLTIDAKLTGESQVGHVIDYGFGPTVHPTRAHISGDLNARVDATFHASIGAGWDVILALEAGLDVETTVLDSTLRAGTTAEVPFHADAPPALDGGLELIVHPLDVLVRGYVKVVSKIVKYATFGLSSGEVKHEFTIFEYSMPEQRIEILDW